MQDHARMASQIVTGVLHRRLSRFAYLGSHEMVHSIAQNLRCCSGKSERGLGRSCVGVRARLHIVQEPDRSRYDHEAEGDHEASQVQFEFKC